MPRIFKGSESTLRLLISKCDDTQSITSVKVLLYTTDIDNAIEVIDGITLEGNVAEINLPSRAFLGMEDGMISYKVEGVVDGDIFITERQSNYYLKTLSRISENGATTQELYITENGEYKITPNDSSYVNIKVNVIGYEEGYTEGYNIGWSDGFGQGEDEGYDNGYDNGYVEGFNNGDAEGYNRGVAEGGSVITENAEVLNITENGTYYTKYVEMPEWTEPLTGDDFYSYAYLQDISFDTGYVGDENSVIEVWYKMSTIIKSMGCMVGKQPVYGGETEKIFKIRSNYYNQFVVEYGGQSVDFLLKDDWNHIKLSYADGVVVNGVQKATFDKPVVPSDVTFYINNNSADKLSVNGYFGMVKIDDNVYIPTAEGFINRTTGEALDIFTTGTYIFYKVEKPVQYDNLIKQVNVSTKIPELDAYGIKLGYSSFTAVPEFVRLTPTASYNNLFKNCAGLTDISLLADWDVSRVGIMSNMFDNCTSLEDITPLTNWRTSGLRSINGMFNYCNRLKNIDALANWDVSNVTDIQNVFKSCTSLTDMTPLANWDTSNVKTMANIFDGCTKITTIPAIDCTSVDTSYNSTSWFGYSEMKELTDFGGFINLKTSSTGSYTLNKCPNLTYESCINILDGLYDFTGNGETPNNYQGKLKVHQNFLDLVGDEISIGTNKGWTITA